MTLIIEEKNDPNSLVGELVNDGKRCGIIKGFHTARPDCAFVVFDCNGNWGNIDNYPAELISFENLKRGWK